MKESEERSSNIDEQKARIRQRYKGIDPEELEVIPALPPEDIFKTEKKLRVAVYARVSTDDPRQTSSYELQKNHYQDVVNKNPNWMLVEIYADEGISGTSLQHRDAFKKMIEDCEAGKIDLIITKSVSRFARNVVDCIRYVRELSSLRPPVGVFFETEHLNTLDPKSEMILSFMSTLAQEESHTKSEIMNSSIEMRFRRGIFLTPPYIVKSFFLIFQGIFSSISQMNEPRRWTFLCIWYENSGFWVHEVKRLLISFYMALCVPIHLRQRTSHVYQDHQSMPSPYFSRPACP